MSAHTGQRNYGLAVAIHAAPMLFVFSIPFAVLWVTVEHYVPSDLGAVFLGCWALFGIWITLAKGMTRVSRDEAPGTLWLLLGVFNFIAALGAFFLVGHWCNV